ncbi:hypothetical protein CHH28_03620 [Bacterioplanes sanyensis]|uniref:Uncharacterized protein n=1 Tax=Bacterioplanes sanyensis TaxID=1249553 RepID=A0A222FFH4_9GAMM|nr:hypothetical protein [Bacterioplanes sanyensis]ASP37817.1 hypothetical protein CHH28_03620 [Bacterioplanes sanyensis]
MKKLLAASAFIVGGFFSAYASADHMECLVDTRAHDQYTPNTCFGLVYGASTATAVFRVVGNGSNIDSVQWSGAAKSCGTSGTSCAVDIRPFRGHRAEALILYSNGTWSKVSATAFFEDGR